MRANPVQHGVHVLLQPRSQVIAVAFPVAVHRSRVLENECDLINMSYGEATATANAGALCVLGSRLGVRCVTRLPRERHGCLSSLVWHPGLTA